MRTFRHLGDRVIHRGHVWDMVVASYEGPDGTAFERDVARSPGAVAAVPIVGTGEDPTVVLVRQYRPPLDEVIVEIPAGMRDVEGEADEDNARRELAEEAGLAPARLELLTELYPSPGMTDSRTAVYLATGCTPVARSPHGPEEEHAEILELALAEALAWIDDGRIRDAKSVIGLLLAARRLQRR